MLVVAQSNLVSSQKYKKNLLMVDDFLAIQDIHALVGSAVKQAALQIEVAAGAVCVDGTEAGLDACRVAVNEWDVVFVVQIVEADVLAGTGALLVANLEHRPVCARLGRGTHACIGRGFTGSIKLKIATEGCQAGFLDAAIRLEACPGAIVA